MNFGDQIELGIDVEMENDNGMRSLFDLGYFDGDIWFMENNILFVIVFVFVVIVFFISFFR